MTARDSGVCSSVSRASAKLVQVSKTCRSSWSGGMRSSRDQTRAALSAKSHGRSQGCSVRRHIGA